MYDFIQPFLKMCIFWVLFFSVTCASPCFATDLNDLRMTDEEKARAIDRAEQEKAKRDHEALQEKQRERSNAEKEIDGFQYPKVEPMYKDGGIGVKGSAPI